MYIEEVSAEQISDSRGEKTVAVCLKTSAGTFSASAPTGKSTGKHEIASYKKNLAGDIAALQSVAEYFSKISLKQFSDLSKVEELLKGQVGGNTAIAFEYAVLKAIAAEQKKGVWKLIDAKAKQIPVFVGNCIGGGQHSHGRKKPDFQEFLLLGKDIGKLREAQMMAKSLLKKEDKIFSEAYNDEHAWESGLENNRVLEILSRVAQEYKLSIGVDVAASSLYARGKYHYKNVPLDRTAAEQLHYLQSLIKKYHILYVEDPFYEEDFESFEKLLTLCPKSMIVGDDLTTTNPIRLQHALDTKSINAIIVKPNQIGSLLKVQHVCTLAKENNLKIIFSHRSGETSEDILADLAVGFGADYLKCGISGKGREEKIERILKIRKEMKKI